MKTIFVVVMAGLAGSAAAQLDGQNIGAGLTLIGVQDTQTQFGNATGGGQNSAGGGELNSLYASLGGGVLNVGIGGNIEGNFNKGIFFFDTKAGGENVLANDNVIGGFNEINNLAGLTFDAAFAPDFAIQFELGNGFYSVRFADLQNNVGGDIFTGGGFAALPTSGAGGFGVSFGWDNSNVLGVNGFGDPTLGDPLSATTGFELSIDLLAAFGDASLSSVAISGFYGNGGLDFLSNQVLGEAGLGGAGNLGGPGGVNFNNFAGNQFAVIPAPASAALLGLGGLVIARRRR
jgi:hypothetical protein